MNLGKGTRKAVALATVVWLGASAPATALQFAFSFSFNTGPFGPDRAAAGEGTPRGLAIGAGGNLLIADSLDDQIYETDASGTLIRNLQTNPYCEVSGPPTCVAGVPEHSAGFLDGVAYQSSTGHIWAYDDPNTGDNRIQELDGDGLFLQEWVVNTSVISGGAIAFDSRNGDLLVTRLSGGSNSIVRLDENDPSTPSLGHNISDTSAPTGLAEFASGVFLVLDATENKIFEYSVPTTPGAAATLLGETSLGGFDLSVTDPLGLAYDPNSERLYIANNNIGDPVHVFTLVPEPGTATLTALGLIALATRRRRPVR